MSAAWQHNSSKQQGGSGLRLSIPRLLQVFGYNLKMINTPMTKLKIFNVCSRCETAEAVLQSLHCL
jgi:hypothetical protein